MLEVVISIFVILFAVVVVLAAAAFLVMEAIDKIDSLRDKAPWLVKLIERRESLNVLLAVCVFLLLGNGYELVMKEIPEVPPPPSVKFITPPPPLVVQPTETPVVKVITPQPKQRAYISFLEPVVTFTVGSPLSVKFGCQTTSDVPAQKVSCNAQSFIVPVSNGDVSVEDERKIYTEFEAASRPNPEPERPTVAKGQVTNGMIPSAIVTTDEETLLNGPKFALLITGSLFYEDDFGSHRIDMCRWVQPPLSAEPKVWHYCLVHEGIVN